MKIRHLAVVMPAHNEEEGIAGFLTEIDAALTTQAEQISFAVIDDLSTDDTARAATSTGLPRVEVLTNAINRGHGPSALAAYRAALATDADVILHVDGDGQFVGSDMARVVRAFAATGAEVAHGSRRGRSDPWFRRVLSRLVLSATLLLGGSATRDVNTPLRMYERDALIRLLRRVPEESLVPHVHFSLLEHQLGLRSISVAVASIPRRGSSAAGTMFGTGRRAPVLPPKKLIRFVGAAVREVSAEWLPPRGRQRTDYFEREQG